MGCIQSREGKYSREIIYKNTSIILVEGVIEEINSQAIVNISINPMVSKLREQVYKYIYNHDETFDFFEERDIIQLEQLRNSVFKSTETLLNFSFVSGYVATNLNQISEEDLLNTFEQILQFADRTSSLYQICFTDYLIYEVDGIDYKSYADCLVKSVFKQLFYDNRFLTLNSERQIVSVKFLCMNAKNVIVLLLFQLNTMLQMMMKYENYKF
ncbi:unnamed protein product (macronuclear) [Paramecium tetraurelia]|uniref:Uncharacterized protein n=1 Tax=Paramecium tetraurelia TaxID=5888 RepID=A0BR55_PARTE|nr:uncharacterized protein GSPATT00031252001 [Paramecium tetraurelia]CAK61022.1 unnamed protein product [Paramecium tetraurelia]|eukprot:XP_001428420.1 hypothetical protein (macronuclear) [Paramecium tetraurelia strain d4-2]